MKAGFSWALVYLMIACSSPKTDRDGNLIEPPKQIELARWLIGSWYSQSNGSKNYEIWTQTNDSTLSGRSYSINHGDTISSEFIRVLQQNDELTYIPTVPRQNKGMPVEFKLTSISRDKMVFENPGHDFPQKITYEYVAADSLVAEISGSVNGERRAMQFRMGRLE